MEERMYPRLEEHKAEHERFSDHIANTRSSVERMQSMELISGTLKALVVFLTDWLANHIMKVDRDYMPYMK